MGASGVGSDDEGRRGHSSGLGCLCGGLSTDVPVSGMDIAGLDGELASLAKIDSRVVARRSLVIAELNRQRSDAAERLKNAGGMSSREAKRAEKTAAGLEKLGRTREAFEVCLT